VLPIDGRPVRWLPLAELLHVPLAPSPGNGRTWPYLLVAQQDQLAAVAVDDLEEESEVLLKPLGFPLVGLPGVVGGTIRPDGSVQVVLDLAAALLSPATVPPPPSAQRRTSPRILVVDDSPTTRAILRNVFTAAGYVVRTATDGVDALERLRAGPADVVVTDVEMPRLNGFDLTRQIKARFGLPVILVTGREQEEHRREGLAAGADAYVVKSTFQGQGLLEVVEQFV
jgi:two-component system chemotaxis sensor kinase CheA